MDYCTTVPQWKFFCSKVQLASSITTCTNRNLIPSVTCLENNHRKTLFLCLSHIKSNIEQISLALCYTRLWSRAMKRSIVRGLNDNKNTHRKVISIITCHALNQWTLRERQNIDFFIRYKKINFDHLNAYHYSSFYFSCNVLIDRVFIFLLSRDGNDIFPYRLYSNLSCEVIAFTRVTPSASFAQLTSKLKSGKSFLANLPFNIVKNVNTG